MSAHTRILPFMHSNQRGFTLVELSIALVVIGIVVAGGLTMTSSMVDRQAYVQTGNQMDEIEKALSAYVATTGKLPCPATANLQLESNDQFGKAPSSCGSSGVAVGMLPVRTLGLRDRMAADEYGNRYTYAVTAALTVSSSQYETAAGSITIKDGNNFSIASDAAYALISHGGDGKGAYRYETANMVHNCGGGKDSENCNNDPTFVNTRFNRGSVGMNWFDDTVRFRPKRLINMSSGSSGELWKQNGEHIYNLNSGNVGIGVGMPDSKLDIDGGNITALGTITSGAIYNTYLKSTGGNSTLHLESIMTSNGLEIMMKSGNPVHAIDIDHIGQGGYGIYTKMNSDLSTGMHITTGDNSTGIFIEAQGNSKGIVVEASAARGIYAQTDAANGIGMYGRSDGNAGSGLYGISGASNSRGVTGIGTSYGVFGQATANNGSGVYGMASSTATNAVGVMGINAAANGFAVYGHGSGTGSIGIYGQSGSGYGVWCQSNLCGGQRGWNETSDARLKDHVATLNDAHGLDAIRKLRPVTYTWKDVGKETLGTQLGFIAQEVEAVLPEVVSTGGDQEIDLGDGKTETITKAKSMMYASITVPLVRAVQQLADAFDALATSVKDMLARVSGLESKITTLESDNAALKESNALLIKRLDAIEAKLAH